MSWRPKHHPEGLRVGDSVAYSRRFLQSIGCYAGDMAHGRGKVTALIAAGAVTLAEVEWDLPDLPGRVNVKNLCHVKEIGFQL